MKNLESGDVRDGSLLAADFKVGQLPAGARGAQGPKGDKGEEGDKGETGRSRDGARLRTRRRQLLSRFGPTPS